MASDSDVMQPAPVDAALFESVERNLTLVEKVTSRVRDLIATGRLSPGDRLPSERDLGQQFGVSRTVVREATRSLAAKGLIEADGRGYRIARVNAGAVTESMTLFLQGRPLSYDQINEVRTTIEIAVARLAAQRATEIDIARMRTQIEAMEAAGDVGAAATADLEFHRAVAAAAHNELFLVMLDSIREVLFDLRRRTLEMPNRVDKGVRAHRRIARGIEAGDVAAAERAMAAHLKDSLRAWSELQRQRHAEP